MSDWSSDVCSSDLMTRCFQCDSPVSPAGRCQCAHNRESEPMSNKCHGCGRRPTACQCYAALSLRSDNLVDRKSTRLNSVTNAHLVCRLLLEKKKYEIRTYQLQTTTYNITD